MKKLLFIILLIALIGCKTKQTIEQEKIETASSIQKMTVTDDSSIITIVYDMLDKIDTTWYNTSPGTNVTANSPKPPNIQQHRKGKIVITKTAKQTISEKKDSTAMRKNQKSPKKVDKHVNNYTLLKWAIITIVILIVVIYVKKRCWLKKKPDKIWHETK